MELDIHKLADWLEKVTREGLALERKILEWKLSEAGSAKRSSDSEPKAS